MNSNSGAGANPIRQPTPGPGRRHLDKLAAEIRRQVEAAEDHFQNAVAHAVRAGELLLEAKASVEHGGWLPWLEANFPKSHRSAQGYMRLARRGEDAQALAHLGVEGALHRLAVPKPPEPPLAEPEPTLAEPEQPLAEPGQPDLTTLRRASADVRPPRAATPPPTDPDPERDRAAVVSTTRSLARIIAQLQMSHERAAVAAAARRIDYDLLAADRRQLTPHMVRRAATYLTRLADQMENP